MYLTKRQKQLFEFIRDFIETRGYSPSLEEIAERFQLKSLATVHKHLTNLEDKGVLKRDWNRSRSIEILPSEIHVRARGVPLLGHVAAGRPIEAIEDTEELAIPEDMLARNARTFALRVTGDSMIDDGIHDGDFVVLEDAQQADNGDTVVALIDEEDVTLKRFYREGRMIRLEPANPRVDPLVVDEERVRIQGIVIGILRKFR